MTRSFAFRSGLPLLLFAFGCVAAGPSSAPLPEPTLAPIDPAIYERAQAERNEYFEREVERLRADLQQAEASIVALESGLRDPHTRADAVSAVAEARIALDRVQQRVPWRSDRVEEADPKLEEAERQLEQDHLGAAMFFASRAERITASLVEEASRGAAWGEHRMIRASRVNLRAGPSLETRVVQVLTRETPVYPERSLPPWQLVRTPAGRIGWVHASLLARSRPDGPTPARIESVR